MAERDVEGFKSACRQYFHLVNSSVLRAYGRVLQLRKPTAMSKKDLTEEIIGVLCGEIIPKRNGKKGAPVKAEYDLQTIFSKVHSLKIEYGLEEETEENESLEPVCPQIDEQEPLLMQLSVRFSQLNKEQKQLFMAFLNSL